jgi:hypothetical protein
MWRWAVVSGGWWCFFFYSTLRYRTGKEGEVEKVAAAVSDPKSPSYGKFLSAQELRSGIPLARATPQHCVWAEAEFLRLLHD